MHDLEKKLVEIGAIDTAIENIIIDDWFENVVITFVGNSSDTVICKFSNCFEISLKHDKTYSKGKRYDGDLDYKYFIQDVEILEEEEFFIIQISAWPLDGKIICKKVEIV